MNDRPKRIIVVDPSLRDNVGHHIEYDLSLLRGTGAEGLQVVVLAHKDAAKLLPANENIVPAFSEDVWCRWRAVADPDVRRNVLLHRLLLLPLVSLLFAGISRTLRRRKVIALAGSLQLTRALSPVVRALQWLAPPVLIHAALVLYHAARDCCERLPGLRGMSFLVLINPRFYFELRKALRRIRFDENDLVFCHMATVRQLLEWGLFAASLPPARFARIVLLLRYPPHFYAPFTPQAQLAFRLLEQAFEAGTLRLATDSERLAREFARHTFVPFEVFPIPHTSAHALSADADAPRRRKLRVASLGNARAEKGILEILEAVRILDAGYDRREDLEFFLQLNDPDKECAAQVRAFLQTPPANVQSIQAALASDAYQRLLASADVVLVPYWGEVYASRTSGVFLEAVAAGKPVVATADTWMADELAEHGAGLAIPSRSAEALAEAIMEIHRDFDAHYARARASAPGYVRRHSAETVLRQLALGPPPRARRARSALVCFPWLGLFERTTGASVRTCGLIDTLRANQWEVVALVPQRGFSPFRREAPREQRPVGMEIVEHDGEAPTPLRSLRLALYTLVTRIRSLGRSRSAEALLFMHRYWLRSRRFKIVLNRCLDGRGAVFAEYTFVAGVIAPLAKARRIPLIVTSHDVLAMQVPGATFRAKVLDAESEALRLADLSVSVSRQDQAAFGTMGAQTVVVPNSVQTSELLRLLPEQAKRLVAAQGIRPEHPFVVFVGSNFGPNIAARDLLRTLAPELGKRVPGAMVVVAGGCAKPSDSAGNFRCLGVVGDDVKAALYKTCGAVVIPLLHGTGTSLKTVEAFAYGRPVIGTSAAFRGLDVEDRVHAIVQDDPRLLVGDIADLLHDAAMAQALGDAARTLAQELDAGRANRPYLDFLDRWEAPKAG